MNIQQMNNVTIKELKNENDKQIISDLHKLITSVTKRLDTYRFSDAAQEIYDFTWHTLADKYIEENKERLKNGDQSALQTIIEVYTIILKLLHPFMPFVTEAIWSSLPKESNEPLIISSWPRSL